jgi:hypothetical protein
MLPSHIRYLSMYKSHKTYFYIFCYKQQEKQITISNYDAQKQISNFRFSTFLHNLLEHKKKGVSKMKK